MDQYSFLEKWRMVPLAVTHPFLCVPILVRLFVLSAALCQKLKHLSAKRLDCLIHARMQSILETVLRLLVLSFMEPQCSF